MPAATFIDIVRTAVDGGHIAAARGIKGNEMTCPASDVQHAFALEIQTDRLDPGHPCVIDPDRRFDVEDTQISAFRDGFALEIPPGNLRRSRLHHRRSPFDCPAAPSTPTTQFMSNLHAVAPSPALGGP